LNYVFATQKILEMFLQLAKHKTKVDGIIFVKRNNLDTSTTMESIKKNKNILYEMLYFQHLL